MDEFYKFLQTYTPYIVLPLVFFGFVFWVTSMFYSFKLTNYLKTKNPERLKEITEVKFFGQRFYGQDSEKSLRYIFGTVDDEDQNILNFKQKIRKFMLMGISLFAGGPLVFVVLFVIATISVKH